MGEWADGYEGLSRRNGITTRYFYFSPQLLCKDLYCPVVPRELCSKQDSPSRSAFCSVKAVLVWSDGQHQEPEETKEQEQCRHLF